MFRGRTLQGSRLGLIAAAIVVMGLAVAACGDDDAAPPVDVATTSAQAPAGGDTAPTAQEPSGAGGAATVGIPEGTFDLTLDEPCVLSETGIGIIASSDSASLMIAGPQEIAVVVVELPTGTVWSAAAASLTIDGNAVSYTGPAMGPGGTADITVQVDCG